MSKTAERNDSDFDRPFKSKFRFYLIHLKVTEKKPEELNFSPTHADFYRKNIQDQELKNNKLKYDTYDNLSVNAPYQVSVKIENKNYILKEKLLSKNPNTNLFNNTNVFIRLSLNYFYN